MSISELPVVTLKPRKALPFFSRHPWVFAGGIGSVSGSPEVGAEVVLKSHEGQFIARGLYNSNSKIRVRLYSWDKEQACDHSLWQQRIDAAIDLRKSLFEGTPALKACRLVFSEADGLSGLVVDCINDWIVTQWTSAALVTHQEAINQILNDRLAPKGIWQRTEKGMNELEGLTIQDGLLSGEEPPRPLFVEENGLKFGVDLQEGQKTGFYFDQRENRAQAARFARGKVLDLCCYSGSFSLNMARQERCESVIGVDSSESALDLARYNAELNRLIHKTSFINSDAAPYLENAVEEGQRFDTIVLDPPKMTRTQGGLNRAIKGYVKLNRLAMQALNPNGILITCSCSGHISRETFEQILLSASLDAKRTVQILEQRGQAADHPVSAACLETNYLKCFICRVV